MSVSKEQLVSWLLLLILPACLSGATQAPAATEQRPAALSGERPAPLDGAALFGAHCASCHGDPGNKRALELPALSMLNPSHIVFAMTNGSMKAQADGLRIDQMIDVAGFIAGRREPWSPGPEHFCQDRSIDTAARFTRWAVDEHSTASLAPGASSINRRNVADLELAWAFGLPDVANARSLPAITNDTLFVLATSGHLFALNRHTGCIKWHRQTDAPGRTALTLGTSAGTSALFFGDMAAQVNAVSALTGETLWRAAAGVSEHSLLTGAPVQHDGMLIVPVSLYELGLTVDPDYECCISHGGVVAFDADTGKRLWTTHTTEPATPRALTEAGVRSWGPSGVPVWSTPTVDADRGLVYVGTGQNASRPATAYSDSVLALELATGRVAWHFQGLAGDVYNMACDQQPPGPNCPKWRGPDHDIGAAVVLTQDSGGHDRLIVGQKSGDIYALDPDAAGEMVWQRRVGAGSALGGVHWGLSVQDGIIYAPVADPPFPIPGYRPAPGLYALAVDDGERLWASHVDRGCATNLFEYFGRSHLYPECSFFFGLSAAPLAAGELLFAAALDGRVRAFDAGHGRVLWTAETARAFETVNGVPAHGGSADVAGVQVVDDMLYVQSGYAQFGQLPGNALLAFRLRDDGEQGASDQAGASLRDLKWARQRKLQDPNIPDPELP